MSSGKIIRYLRFFESKKQWEHNLRFHFRVANFRADLIMNLPYLVRGIYILKDYAWFTSKSQHDTRNEYGPQHIYDVKTSWLRFGYDAYMGEVAVLFPLLKLWLDCDFLSNRFRQFGRFTLFNIFAKISLYEVLFKLKIAGIGIGFHLPFYEIKAIERLRKRKQKGYIGSGN